MSDDLSAPLGRSPQRGRAKNSLVVPAALAGLLGLCLLVFGLWTAVVTDPLGGEPSATIAIESRGAKPAEPALKAQTAAKTEPAAEPHGDQAGKAPAKAPAQTVTIIDGTSGQRQEVQIPAEGGGGGGGGAKSLQGETRLLESTRHGFIPRVALDGARAQTVYAGAVPAAAKSDQPRIALVIGGLGISGKYTAEAFAKLPAPVTFAFSPYATDLGRLASRARGEGHELLLQVPMEPLDYPENDPGPQTLLTTLAPEQNIDRLHWLMSRFQGYVGIVNFMGARFTATESSLSPVLREAAKRGLMFLDDASSPRSLSGQIAGANSVAFVKAAVVLDVLVTPADIDRALGRLESAARDSGVAVGYATAHPVSIDRLSRWAKAAEGRGFVLVPLTNAAAKPKSAS